MSPADAADIAELDKVIPFELRIKNKGPNCGWCALEDIMVAAGYEQFKGMRDRAYAKGWGGNTISNVEAALKESGVEYIMVRNRDFSIFDHARKEGVGVYVEIPGHALVCVAIDSKHAYMIDNNGDLKIERWSRDRFNRLWQGVACCPKFRLPRIFKPKPKDEQIKPPPPAEVKPVAPAPVCPCPVKPGVDCKCDPKSLTDALGKLTEVAMLTNKSVDSLAVKVGGIDQRLVVVEGKLAGGNSPATPPLPSATTPDPALKKIQDDLDNLKKTLNGEATLRVTVTPR